MNLKVLHVIHWPKSGVTTLMRNVIAELPRNHIDSSVVFIECDGATESHFKELTKHVYCLQFAKRPISALIGLIKILKNQEPDIVHVHSLLPAIVVWLLVRKRFKVIRTIHSVYPYFHQRSVRSALKRWIEKQTLRHANTIVCVAHGVKMGLPWVEIKNNASVIENGIDLSSWKSVRGKGMRRQLGFSEDALVFVTMGRLEHQKGYDMLIDAFVSVSQTHERARLVIIGEGSERENLERRIRQNKLEERVKLLGHRYDPQRYIGIGDVYVSSSRYEGFGLAQAEAMASGIPVVTTPTAGVAEKIKDHQSGFLTKDISVSSLADTMDYVCKNSACLASVGENGRRLSMEAFSVEITAKKYDEIYRGFAC